MKIKIKDNKELNKKELLLIGLLCFMKTDRTIDDNILDSAEIITNIPNLNYEIGQFVKGIILMLCDKFVKDELTSKRISNLIGGNMKIVEDYARRFAKKEVKKVKEEKDKEIKESKKNFVINLDNEGYSENDIARLADVSLEFVKQKLST